MTCRYDREREAYINDGELCLTDEYGDPTRHCTARKTCSNHIGWGELTCARCIGRTRTAVRQLLTMTALMPDEALAAGVVSTDAAMYAGPVADMAEYAENREGVIHRIDTALRQGRLSERQHLKEMGAVYADDESHPANVLGVWCRMWAEDYGLEPPDTRNLSACVAFVDRNLARVAQDEEQDFPLFAREVRACHKRMATALRDSDAQELGAPCPECVTKPPRLIREYGHWCMDEDCERLHYATDEGDMWVCQRNRDHAWTHDAYSKWVEDRRATRPGA